MAILDVDAHHGDGTQQIFYSRPDVLTVSVHADPEQLLSVLYRLCGERGSGAGDGFNLNLPLAHGSDRRGDVCGCRSGLAAIRDFKADVVVVALGFDAHARDPIGVLKLESGDFAGIGAGVRELHLPTLVVQEGGYAIDAIGDCLTAFLTDR